MATPTQVKIIGNGPVGGKSREMLTFAKEFGDVDLPVYGDKRLSVKVPSFVPITPLLCEEIAKKAGCSMKEDDPKTAREKIMNSRDPLLKKSMEKLYDAEYGQNTVPIYAFRSDDVGFSGIMPTEFACANFNNSKASIVENFMEAAAEVISGRFSVDAKIARERLPFWSEGGIMFMPFYGEELANPIGIAAGWREKKYTAPSLTASFIAPLEDSEYYRWQFFRGISAYASPRNLERFNGLPNEIAAYTCMEGSELHALAQVQTSPWPLGLRTDAGKSELSFFKSMMHHPPSYEDTLDISMGMNEMVMDIKGAFGKAYLELLCPSSENPFDWLFMQFSNLEFIGSKRPKERPSGEGWAGTSQVMGFADKICSVMHFADEKPNDSDRKFNKNNKNYVLVINAVSPWDFQDNWHLPDFSNAGAIVMVVSGRRHPAISHMGGLARMMGVPILVYDKMSRFGGAEMIMNSPCNAKYRVIADEAAVFGGIRKE